MIQTLLRILVFPGMLFVVIFGLFAEFVDRKVYARLQNRAGPPWFQPFADCIKLLAKEHFIPCEANPQMFFIAPLAAFTAVVTAFLYIPLWDTRSVLPFYGDIIVVLYLLTIPTLAFFIGGWYSTSLFSRIGSVRALTQLFAYEVPLFMSVLSSALLAGSWSLDEVTVFYAAHPGLWLCNSIGFAVALVSLLGKLEKVPFDIPEAETEVVGGVFTEYSGRLLAVLRLTIDVEMVAGSSLLAAVFLPFGFGLPPAAGFVLYLCKVIGVVICLSLLRTIFARLRIDQMIDFCWKYMVPLALFQMLLNLYLKRIAL